MTVGIRELGVDGGGVVDDSVGVETKGGVTVVGRELVDGVELETKVATVVGSELGGVGVVGRELGSDVVVIGGGDGVDG